MSPVLQAFPTGGKHAVAVVLQYIGRIRAIVAVNAHSGAARIGENGISVLRSATFSQFVVDADEVFPDNYAALFAAGTVPNADRTGFFGDALLTHFSVLNAV